MAKFLNVQVLDNQSATGSDPTGATDGIAVPVSREGRDVHMQIVVAGGTSISYQASLCGFRSAMKAADAETDIGDGSEIAWVRLFITPAGQQKSGAWAIDGTASQYSRLAIVIDALSGTSPDIDAALAFSSMRP